jgi:hypothetical protein
MDDMKSIFALLLMALTTVGVSGNSSAHTNREIPVPSCERINYSDPKACLSLNAKSGNKNFIFKVAAKISGKTPEEKLVSINNWIQSNLACDPNAPYEWCDFDGILRDGSYGGSADYSVVFGALARACGIPTVWVKTLDADWIREYCMHGTEGHWNGHVFLEIFIHDRWVLLDDTQLVFYEYYDPRMRILPGNRYAYDKGKYPYDLVISSQWGIWKEQTRVFCRDFDLLKLPVGQGKSLLHGTKMGSADTVSATQKYPAVFVFYPEEIEPSARILFKTLYPNLTHHLTARHHSPKDYQEQFGQWA